MQYKQVTDEKGKRRLRIFYSKKELEELKKRNCDIQHYQDVQMIKKYVVKARQKAYQKAYNQRPEVKARQKAYNQQHKKGKKGLNNEAHEAQEVQK